MQPVSVYRIRRTTGRGGKPSVARVGNCHENALAGTTCGRLEAEVTHRRGLWRGLDAVSQPVVSKAAGGAPCVAQRAAGSDAGAILDLRAGSRCNTLNRKCEGRRPTTEWRRSGWSRSSLTATSCARCWRSRLSGLSYPPKIGHRRPATICGHLVFQKMEEMAKRKRQASEAKVALEAAKGEQTVAGLAARFDVHPTPMHQGKKALLEGAFAVFEKRASNETPEADAEAVVPCPGSNDGVRPGASRTDVITRNRHPASRQRKPISGPPRSISTPFQVSPALRRSAGAAP